MRMFTSFIGLSSARLRTAAAALAACGEAMVGVVEGHCLDDHLAGLDQLSGAVRVDVANVPSPQWVLSGHAPCVRIEPPAPAQRRDSVSS